MSAAMGASPLRAIGVALVLSSAGLLLTACEMVGSPSDSTGVHAPASPDPGYWTEERMRDALPG